MVAEQLIKGIDPKDLRRIVRVEHSDPHSVLGAHPAKLDGQDGVIVRAFHPDAVNAKLLLGDKTVPMKAPGPKGLFCCFLPKAEFPVRYLVSFEFPDSSTWIRNEPYQFGPTLGEHDLHYVGEGKHYELYEKLGAHLVENDGVKGVGFAVWAPNAVRVSVVGDFNRWDGRLCPMRSMGSSGIWEIFIPDLQQGDVYKYEIKTRGGQLRIKTDPYAFAMELRPETASIVWDLDKHQWHDEKWLAERRDRDPYTNPMNIYELHLGSWLRIEDEDNRWATYTEIAPELVQHLKKYGSTHVELMPVMEHPFDGSWGYQVTGYFAPTSRFGVPDDFMSFVDTLHQNGIGVILDWVPAHFPKDDFSLRLFDGTELYEHADPRMGEHPDWGTLIFNYGRHEVRNFLVSNALFWLDKYHVDGLRVDAVASMVYLDYSREAGEWVPNRFGQNENLEAIEFLQEFNAVVYGRFPGCFTVAEESTAFTGVTTPTHLGGLGFGFKWDMGWMHDTLLYFSKEPVHRSYHLNDLTFSMMYAYSENFILPLSHDEVTHGKGSLLRKMPGDDWQKAANLRLLFAYMYTHPGKKLLMAGSEFATWNEWYHESSLERRLQQYPFHSQISALLMDLGRLYLADSALWKWDHVQKGFSWIDCNDYLSSVISYIRRGPEGFLVCVLNFTPVVRHDYRIGVPEPGEYEEVINTDSRYYGGSDVGNGSIISTFDIPMHGHKQSLNLVLPPLGALILRKRQVPNAEM